MRLRRLRRERDLIDRQIQEMPEGSLREQKRDLLRKLDRLIQRLEGQEDAVLRIVLDEEREKATKERSERARCDALLALVTALAALTGYSINVPADAGEADLLHAFNVLHGLFVQQLVWDLLEHTPPTAGGALHPWLQPLPDLVDGLAQWRNRSRPHPT